MLGKRLRALWLELAGRRSFLAEEADLHLTDEVLAQLEERRQAYICSVMTIWNISLRRKSLLRRAMTIPFCASHARGSSCNSILKRSSVKYLRAGMLFVTLLGFANKTFPR